MIRPLTWTRTKEKWGPIVLALLVSVLGFFLGNKIAIEPLLFGATITFGAIHSGFTGSSLSILIVLDSPTMRFIRKTKLHQELTNYLGRSIFSGIVVSLSSVLCLMFLTHGNQTDSLFECVLFALWQGTLAYCVLCFVRLAVIMLRLFSSEKKVQ